MSAAAVIARRLRRKFTAQEYLLLERQASCKSDFYDGELFAMAGASREHNLITLSIAGVRAQVRGTGCEVYASDMRAATALGSFFHPDVVVVCGTPHFAGRQKDTLTNPVLIVEVLSKSTQQFDRLVKLAEYQHIPSVREILFVPQDRVRVEHYSRKPRKPWTAHTYLKLSGVVEIASLSCALPLAEIYAGIQFE